MEKPPNLSQHLPAFSGSRAADANGGIAGGKRSAAAGSSGPVFVAVAVAGVGGVVLADELWRCLRMASTRLPSGVFPSPARRLRWRLGRTQPPPRCQVIFIHSFSCNYVNLGVKRCPKHEAGTIHKRQVIMQTKQGRILFCLLAAALIAAFTGKAQPIVTKVVAGENDALFLKSDGSLWGTNNYVLQMTTNLASGVWVTATNYVPMTAWLFTNAPANAFFRFH